MSTKTILVVDPDTTVGTLIASILQEEKLKVTIAQSLEEASRLLSTSCFDLIITEAFNQKNQFDFDPSFLSEITSPECNAPILLCSTYASFGMPMPVDSGLSDVLPKPFDLDDLLNKVNRLLNNGGPVSNGTHKGPRHQAA